MYDLTELLIEYDRSRHYSDLLTLDLTTEELNWRPDEHASAIAWHLGHQAHVAHFMLRNLTAAEPSPNGKIDRVMDSATPEPERDHLPTVTELREFRSVVADRVHDRVRAIEAGEVAAPQQLRVVACHLLITIINHEYQHDQWIAEVRANALARPLPALPDSPNLTTANGYLMLA